MRVCVGVRKASPTGEASLQREASRREAQRKRDRQEVGSRESAFSS
ncbi:hypothetical protein COO91_06002 [Nostoc flagelliforme CCNUN1]|uniref:Uncharacterized protein n=1 Tax=Nostoc flagelliforme CCNUN1 TaxID=2038116 RepID=A0A2K8SZ32_9NOSO|nr:hypothetical protein COO91_06002 [Nostoc flagelliforme CCNUN1]